MLCWIVCVYQLSGVCKLEWTGQDWSIGMTFNLTISGLCVHDSLDSDQLECKRMYKRTQHVMAPAWMMEAYQ